MRYYVPYLHSIRDKNRSFSNEYFLLTELNNDSISYKLGWSHRDYQQKLSLPVARALLKEFLRVHPPNSDWFAATIYPVII